MGSFTPPTRWQREAADPEAVLVKGVVHVEDPMVDRAVAEVGVEIVVVAFKEIAVDKAVAEARVEIVAVETAVVAFKEIAVDKAVAEVRVEIVVAVAFKAVAEALVVAFKEIAAETAVVDFEEEEGKELQRKYSCECFIVRSTHRLTSAKGLTQCQNSHGPGVPTQSNPEVQKVEDGLQQSYKSKKPTTELSFPHRPGYGTKGNPITLWANYFELVSNKDLVLYRYVVDVHPDAAGKAPTGGKLRRLFQLLIEQHFEEFRNYIATDYKSMIICRSQLEITEKVLSVEYRAENEDDPRPNSPTYELRLRATGTLSVGQLMDYLTSTNVSSVYDSKEQIIQALNIVLGHHPKTSATILSVGANRHYSLDPVHAEKFRLGAGLEALRGYFVSVRAAAARILVNVQVKHVACFEAVPLDQLMASYLASNGPNYYKLGKFLHHVRVEVTHIIRKNKAGQEVPRIKTIAGLAMKEDGHGLQHPPRVAKFGAGAKQVEFYLSGPVESLAEEFSKLGGPSSGGKGKKSGGKSGGKAGGPSGKKSGPGLPENEYISVFDHFRRFHNKTIKNIDLPVVNVGNRQNPSYLPAEVCIVVTGQPSNTKLSPGQTAGMIEFAVRKAAQNARSITTNGASVLGVRPQLNATLQNFNLSVTPRLIAVPGRVLMGPAVQYKGPRNANTQFGSWNMRDIQFTRGTNVPSWTYLSIIFRSQNDAWYGDYNRLKATIDDFRRTLSGTGVAGADPFLPGLSVQVSQDGSDHDAVIDDALGRLVKHERNLKLLLVILPKPITGLYNRVKFVGDVKLGIHTICVVGSKFAKNNVQYFANVALKFNLKLGGVNQSLEPSKLGIISEGKTMVVGIDVTHPSPGSASTAPSVAGIVASIDARLGQWPADIRIQASRQEMVSGLDELLTLRLKYWRAKNNRFPDNLLVYRDGVSEGQYNLVLEQELPLLRKACAQLYPPVDTKKGLPNITIIVVGKRHHTRFYPTSEENADNSSNPKNGTVVDRGVTEPRNWDFFLQAHTALKGTARPAHYFIIIDEIFHKQKVKPPFQNSADVLEDLTHNMCYLFGRATKAVSVCPPAYYADLVCERARCYLSGVFDATPMATPAASVVGGEREVDPGDVVIHGNLRDSMFYI
ncbi:MAG: hypothetical protein M1839_006474 [Geoglossum umbratile]|nr:MAG: hypothetical protein M1839_006474 [Geoglossum umbratile]